MKENLVDPTGALYVAMGHTEGNRDPFVERWNITTVEKVECLILGLDLGDISASFQQGEI